MEISLKMASKLVFIVVSLFAILSITSANYVEALAAEAFEPSSVRVEMRVALREGHYSKYADIVSGLWVTDTSAEYTADPTQILNYCKKKYPNSDITNIVDSSQPLVIDQWCPVNGEACTSSAEVTYYRCLFGSFESDALMVYNVCKFFHKHDESLCREPGYWKGVATKDCAAVKMAMNSTGMLLPCETDKFKGVEYTCCPPPAVVEQESPVTEAVPLEESPARDNIRDNVAPRPQITSNILSDPFFSEIGISGGAEKKAFADAKTRLSATQKSKMARVMQQWQEAQEHYEKLKTKDMEAAEKMRKEMTQRFEETIGLMDAENEEETEELREAHQVHIETSLREKINTSYEAYHSALIVTHPKARKIIHCLRRYLHAVQKARQHYIGHYKHLRHTDPLKADEHKHYTLTKLRTLDLEVANSVDQLQDIPNLYNDLKPKVDALLKSTQDAPEDAALIQATVEEEIAEATESPVQPPQRVPSPQAAESAPVEPQQQPVETQEEIQEGEVLQEVEEEVTEQVTVQEDTAAPALAKVSDVKPGKPIKTKPTTTNAKPVPPTKSHTQTQAQPEPPTPPREIVEDNTEVARETETEIEVPAPGPAVAGKPEKPAVVVVKPIDSYLDDELTGPIEAEIQQPIIARKPVVKVQKSAAAARVEKQRLVNRQGADTIDNSVKKQHLQLTSEPMMAFGLACGVLAVATVLVIAVLIVRRKTRRTPVNNGFTEIDPNLTVEQRHIVAMQQNGYENPTYKFFDMQ